MSRVVHTNIWSAYGYARKAGYEGTEEEFEQGLKKSAEAAGNAEESASTASEAATEAEAARDAAAQSAESASTSEGNALEYANSAAQVLRDAQAVAQTVNAKATDAAGSASRAENYAQTATTKASEATTAAGTATTAASSASGSAQAADASATAAAASETNAAASASSASTSASSASESADAAAASADEAKAVQESIPEDYSQLSADVTDLKSQLKASLNTINISITATTKTNIMLDVGDSIDIYVKTNNGNTQCYIDGHSGTNVLLLSTASVGNHYTYTAQHSGYVRFYLLSATNFEADLYINSESRSAINDNAANIKTLTASMFYIEDLFAELGSLNTATGVESSSSTAMRTALLPDGVTRVLCSNATIRVYAYEKSGAFVGGRTNTGEWTKDYTKYHWFYSPFNIFELNDNYNYRIVFGNIVGGVTLDNIQPKIEINNIEVLTKDHATIYEVGSGKQFSTFTGMLTALKDDDSKKIVYIYPGTYDIFEEMGGANFIASVDLSKNWRDVNNIVPPNTTIVGIGDVVLAWNPTDAQIIDNNHAFLFSPLNLSGSCTIKNIKIQCSNCRYGILDETSGRAIYDNIVHEFEDVEVIYSQSTYGTHYAYGAGHNRNCKYKYKNCIFSAAWSVAWSIHDWSAGVNEKSTFDFDNCAFIDNLTNNPAAIRFSSSDTVGRLDEAKINGCVFNSITFGTEGSSTIKQGYTVQTMLCKPYTVSYTSHIPEVDRIAPIDYLVLE